MTQETGLSNAVELGRPEQSPPPAGQPGRSSARDAVMMAKAYAVTTLKAPGLLLGSKQYILLLSHWRGFTSLLSHVLGSHPEICGACEHYQAYQSSRDLLKLRYKAYWIDGHKAHARYFFDKVLDNVFPISDQILNRKNVQLLFMLRKPAPTIASMMRLGLDHADSKAFFGDGNATHCCNLYVDRLRMLGEHSAATRRPAIYLDADDIVERTDVILGGIRDALGLRQPLSEQYQAFDHTGKGAGDPSNQIKSGRINRGSEHRYEVTIPDEVLERAEQAYEQTRAALRERCICL